MSEPALSARATLYKKIAAVTAAVSRIPKNGENSFYHYKYATESDITDGLRALLHEHGLAFLPPSVLEYERNETGATTRSGAKQALTRVKMQFEIGCCDTGEVYSAIFWGEGQDADDKGFYKAYTGAVKYFLLKTFLIATGDDPEQDDRQPDPPRSAARKSQPAPAQNGADPGIVPICPEHKTPMKPGKDGASFFCPIKHDGKWYSVKAQPAEPPGVVGEVELPL